MLYETRCCLMEYKNYVTLKKFSFKFDYYCFFDVAQYLADEIFIKHKVRVWFRQEFQKHESNYLVIFCKVKKKDKKEFLASLEELKSKMLLLGYTDYPDFCEELMKNLEEQRKELS